MWVCGQAATCDIKYLKFSYDLAISDPILSSLVLSTLQSGVPLRCEVLSGIEQSLVMVGKSAYGTSKILSK